MKSLDEVLSERAKEDYQNKLIAILDPSTWDLQNRDDKLSEVRSVSEEVCSTTIDFVRELIDNQIDGKPILWLKIKEQFIAGEIELLTSLRAELDSMLEIAPEVPISHDWLSENIRKRYKELAELNEAIEKAVENSGEVEEI